MVHFVNKKHNAIDRVNLTLIGEFLTIKINSSSIQTSDADKDSGNAERSNCRRFCKPIFNSNNVDSVSNSYFNFSKVANPCLKITPFDRLSINKRNFRENNHLLILI
ncbi:MAG: hypothetical protein B6D45_08390 [Ignavibacteriales bacterium UTCHB3]|nr:MAG: hypothetical protein B6D45_08390 [Ignavibacteriales bacterium UTCHB3]